MAISRNFGGVNIRIPGGTPNIIIPPRWIHGEPMAVIAFIMLLSKTGNNGATKCLNLPPK